jgi:hypothetical protein
MAQLGIAMAAAIFLHSCPRAGIKRVCKRALALLEYEPRIGGVRTGIPLPLQGFRCGSESPARPTTADVQPIGWKPSADRSVSHLIGASGFSVGSYVP